MIANFSSWFVFKGGGSEISVKISRSSLGVSLSVIKSKSFVNLFSEHSSLLLSLLMLRHFRVLFIKTAWHNLVSASWIDRSLLRQILNVFFLMVLWSCLRLVFKKRGCLGAGSFLNFPILGSGVRTVWTEERRADVTAGHVWLARRLNNNCCRSDGRAGAPPVASWGWARISWSPLSLSPGLRLTPTN